MLQTLPRVWRFAPRSACLRRAGIARRVPTARPHVSLAAPAQDNVAKPVSKLVDGPQFHYFVNQHSQQSSERPVVKTVGSAPPRKVYIETYGCQMNVNDSEVLLSVLADNEFAETQQDTDADIIFLNTCAIREQAEQRIWSRLGTLKHLKKKNKTRYTAHLPGFIRSEAFSPQPDSCFNFCLFKLQVVVVQTANCWGSWLHGREIEGEAFGVRQASRYCGRA